MPMEYGSRDHCACETGFAMAVSNNQPASLEPSKSGEILEIILELTR